MWLKLTMDKPPLAPGVADDEALLEVVVAHGAHGMATQLLVSGLRHHHVAGPSNLHGLEARQNCKAEHEGVAVLQARLELAQVLGNAGVANDLAFLGQLVRLLIRLLLEEAVLVIILPHAFRAHTDLGHHLDAVADHGTSILVHAALHQALVVVDEQAARCEVRKVLVVLHRHLVQGEVEGGRQSVGCAAAQVSLVEDGEATVLRAKVNDLLCSWADEASDGNRHSTKQKR